MKLTFIREDDSIPLADGDPADFVEDSLVSEDKRKVGLVSVFFWYINNENKKTFPAGVRVEKEGLAQLQKLTCLVCSV